MHAFDTPAQLAWPALQPMGDMPPLAPAMGALAVCEALERRLRVLDQYRLPAQVARDVDELARDLDELQGLVSSTAGEVPVTGRAGQLLADLQAWLPVCEAWIGADRPATAAWPSLAS